MPALWHTLPSAWSLQEQGPPRRHWDWIEEHDSVVGVLLQALSRTSTKARVLRIDVVRMSGTQQQPCQSRLADTIFVLGGDNRAFRVALSGAHRFGDRE